MTYFRWLHVFSFLADYEELYKLPCEVLGKTQGYYTPTLDGCAVAYIVMESNCWS